MLNRQQFQVLGDVANIAFFLATAAVTYCMLFRYPNESYFDASWLEHGFCVSHPESPTLNSHSLSFYSDTVMSMVLALCYYHYSGGFGGSKITKQKSTNNNMPELQRALLFGAVVGVFFHGTGHLYVGLMDAAGTDFRWDSQHVGRSIVSSLVVIAALSGIFQGTLALAPFSRILGTALLGTCGITLLNVSPVLLFVYIQGLIYLSSALHMLSLDSKHKQNAVYLLHPLLQFPVLAIGVMESTRCQQVLAPVGGHVMFDTAISVGSLAAPILASYLDAAADSGKKKL